MLGKRLIELRKEKRLTQESVAKLLHMSRSTYAQYEVERRVPEYGTLEKMADFYETSIDYLTGRSDTRTPTMDEKVQDLIEFLTNKETTVNGKPIPQSLIDDILGYVRIHLAKGNETSTKDK